MKKRIALILVIIISVLLCACNSTEDEKKEMVDIGTVISDLSNGAKAKMNVGKSTYCYGKITNIGSSDCQVKLIYPVDSVNIQLPLEVLAELEVGEYVAICTEIVEYDDKEYTFLGNNIAEIGLMDDYVRKVMSKYSELELSATTIRDKIIEDFVDDDLLHYVVSRGEAFAIRDDNELKEYLIGTWERGSYGGPCEFKADGTYLWKYKEQWAPKVWRERESEGVWSVASGRLNSFMESYPLEVYVLSDDAFMCANTLHVRQK